MNKQSFEPVIGLEVHIQAKSKSKMFCSCSAEYFQSAPNTHTCPVCLGLPGAMPVPNKFALDKCIKLALALNCNISRETKFDRKNYFYPDLPKGFQISQYDQPIGTNGKLECEKGSDTSFVIGITRVHQEEDTGKSTHTNGETLLDYNKSGVPLIEVVTEPDFKSKSQVTTFAKRLRQIVRYLDISNADMEKGEMRFELNISLRTIGSLELPKYKVEVKNIASISVLEKVIDSEIERQSQLLDSNVTPIQETRGLVDMSGSTISQRTKEAEAGYRYFPEPDIPPIYIDESELRLISKEIVELPEEKKLRYVKEFKIEPDVAENIISDVDKYKEFESVITNENISLLPTFSKWYTGEFFALSSSERSSKFELKWLLEIIELVENKSITRTSAKEILYQSFTKGIDPKSLVNQGGFEVVSDNSKIESVVDKVISDNPKALADLKKNPNTLMFFVGQAMKELKGQADVNSLKEIIDQKLKKYE